ncbi:universal stress protein [Mycobacterium heckeshornense]|uniref:Universal stress protein n=1 Tax=Mycobacterium heckeshornense TaxID=110505 RepID=A0A7R7TTP4_9MYCO|nr:universal stress protein [Mycobacterium heckeshornense]MCV7036021.1 universal stress protein [Mycobacterium heckeshornense]BCO34863.1 universal stress protein [Mycobacterium heckeshornense]BCQ08032.1 universal stress protein [Mycobacterium heckeshornense]
MVDGHIAKSVVVGIDGSRAAVAAAQWGADEAVGHAVPLRLVHVIDRNRGFTPDVVKAQSLVAAAALQDARAAVEATHTPVKVELESIHGDPGTVLLQASRSAVLLCVGSPKAAPHGPSDSLAANMAASAHCSVAIVPATQYSDPKRAGCRIAALVNFSTADQDVLQEAMEEAQLRAFPLCVVRTSQCPSSDLVGDRQGIERSHAAAAVEESLVNWRRYYPGIEINIVHTDQFLRYVTMHQQSIRSVVLGAEYHNEVAQLIELTRSRALRDADFSVYVVRSQHL